MDSAQMINKEVNVNALYFRGNGNFKAFPKRMEFNGREYTFQESGLQLLIQKGQSMVKLFEMTDGENSFRLRFDPTQHAWTLLNMQRAPRAF